MSCGSCTILQRFPVQVNLPSGLHRGLPDPPVRVTHRSTRSPVRPQVLQFRRHVAAAIPSIEALRRPWAKKEQRLSEKSIAWVQFRLFRLSI